MQNYMKKSIPVIVLSLCTILFLGCSDDPEVMPQDTIPPNGCFDLSIEKTLDRCIRYDFELDASCTVDNLNSTNDIEIRWDFDSDGVFDTGYDTVKKVSYYPSSSIIDSAYVTLAARDRNYNVSLLTQKLDLSELPTSPDLIAGELTIGEFDENLDTVSVGESFLIIVNSTCFGDFLSPKFATYIYINGEIIREDIGGCSGGFSGCGSSGKPYSINVAGTYELYFDLDATNIYAEIDEMNNQSAKKTLTVIE